MKPIDLRDATWQGLQEGMSAALRRAYGVWAAHGPATTRTAAGRGGWDILTFRPRTTDLCHLGLVELVGRDGNEGIYAARGQGEWEKFAAGERGGAVQCQAELPRRNQKEEQP